MHIRCLAIGTQGDVQPYVALGMGLKRAGFEVSVATTANFRNFVTQHGLDSLTTELDLQAAATRSRQQRGSAREARWTLFRTLLAETERLAQGADLLLYSPVASLSVPHVAERMGIPAFPALLQPYMNPTADFPAVLMPALSLGGWYNRFTYRLFEGFTWTFLKRAINTWREETLGLPPLAGRGPFTALRESGVPTLYGFSPTVLPKPAEWGPTVHVTGYWFLPPDAAWSPPPELVAFLRGGPPPIYIGFGSIASRDPAHTTRVILDAVQQAGVRAILATGWDGLAAIHVPPEVHVVASIPHSWLFPQMAAVVHHGGAGTTGAGLRAGVPTVVVPAGGDQPFWGRRIQALGAGPAPIPHKTLNAQRLAAAIRQAVEDPSIRQRALALGQAIRAEDGVGTAVRLIKQLVGHPSP